MIYLHYNQFRIMDTLLFGQTSGRGLMKNKIYIFFLAQGHLTECCIEVLLLQIFHRDIYTSTIALTQDLSLNLGGFLVARS